MQKFAFPDDFFVVVRGRFRSLRACRKLVPRAFRARGALPRPLPLRREGRIFFFKQGEGLRGSPSPCTLILREARLRARTSSGAPRHLPRRGWQRNGDGTLLSLHELTRRGSSLIPGPGGAAEFSLHPFFRREGADRLHGTPRAPSRCGDAAAGGEVRPQGTRTCTRRRAYRRHRAAKASGGPPVCCFFHFSLDSKAHL